MTTKIVYRDKEGKVINIGEWDYIKEIVDEYGDDGDFIGSNEITHNPLPEGATSAIEEIITLEDGGLGVAIP